jgi:hypothetical protein
MGLFGAYVVYKVGKNRGEKKAARAALFVKRVVLVVRNTAK